MAINTHLTELPTQGKRAHLTGLATQGNLPTRAHLTGQLTLSKRAHLTGLATQGKTTTHRSVPKITPGQARPKSRKEIIWRGIAGSPHKANVPPQPGQQPHTYQQHKCPQAEQARPHTKAV